MSVRVAVSAFAHRSARRSQVLEHLLYSGGVVVLVLLLSAWIVEQARLAPHYSYTATIPWSVIGLADVLSVMLLALGLFVLAPAVVAATVAGERRSGTLDQLRTTPLEPLGLVVALVFGAPARIYLLCVGPLALHVVAGLCGPLPLDTLSESLAVLAAGALGCALLGLVVALAPRQESGGAFIALGVAALLGVSGLAAAALTSDHSVARWAYLHPAGALDAAYLQHDGLWRRMVMSDWGLERFERSDLAATLALTPVLTLLALLPVIALLGRAACRKLAAPHLPLFSKPQALALFTLAAAGVILPLDGDLGHYPVARAPLAFGLVLLPVLLVLGLFATPTFESWALLLRRRRGLAFWHDEAAPHATVWAMIAVFFALLAIKLGSAGFPFSLYPREAGSLAAMIFTAITLPVYLLFASTRFPTSGARWAFCAAVAAHLILQMITIALVHDGALGEGAAGTVTRIGLLAAVAVPAWVLYRQRALRLRTVDNS